MEDPRDEPNANMTGGDLTTIGSDDEILNLVGMSKELDETLDHDHSKMGKKRCALCGIEKFKDQFPKKSVSADGLAALCYECTDKRRDEARAKRVDKQMKRMGGDIDAMVEGFERDGMPKKFLAGQWMDILINTGHDATKAMALKALGELYGYKGGDKDSKDERSLIQAVLKAQREEEQ